MISKFKLASLTIAVCAALGAASAAEAATITLPLGPIHTGDDILNYFNGGTDSGGEGPGTNLGIGFSANAEAQKTGTSAATGDGKFQNNPSGQSEILNFAFSNSTAPYINYAAGFSSLSFAYSFSNNSIGTGTENAYIYSGVNGSGTLLDTISLAPAATTTACTLPGYSFCTWSMATTGALSQTAESVVFGSSATPTATGTPVDITEFDDVQLTPVPLPASIWLLLGGFGGLAGWARRRTALSSPT
jgi:hypothetical protein